MKTRLLIIILVAITSSILVVFVFDSMYLDRLCEDSGGKRTGDICQLPIVTATINDSETSFDISQITTMKPNSMEFFYYPNPEDTENRDVFQKFILIRLSEYLGGATDDVSSFRAYSSVSVTSDHCLIKYWPDAGRQRMEDPCWGSMYRVIDGLLVQYPDPFTNNSLVALPRLNLSIDGNGSLYVESPKWTLQENGVIGVGRTISIQEVHQGSQFLVDSYQTSYPNHPKIHASFVGYRLTELHTGHDIEVRYVDFSSLNNYIDFQVDNVSAQDQQYFRNLAKSNSELWQIDDVIIKISGSALDKNNDQPERFKTYDVEFILDGFKFTIEGKNIESIKKAIVVNYFPEHTYDDMFLISSTVEN